MSLPLTQPLPDLPRQPQPRPQVVPPRRSRAGVGGLLLLLLAGAAALWYFTQPKEPTGGPIAIRTAVAKRGPIEVRVRVAGQTAARNFANITAPKLMVPEGDRDLVILQLAGSGTSIKGGDIVAVFDPQSAKDHIDDTEDRLKQKTNDVAKKRVQHELDLENLQQSLRVAKATLDKARLELKATEIRSDIDREILKLAEEEAAAAYKEKLADLEMQRQSQKADMRITEIGEEEEKRHVNRHKIDLAKFTIHAPFSGMVVLLQQNRPGGEQATYAIGDRVSPGTTFARLIDPDRMQIEGSINQSESSHFRLGQDAVIRLDAYPGVTYKGKVASIGALATGGFRQQYYIRAIPIRVWIDNADRRVLPDLSGSAEVLIHKEENALLIPSSAVKADNGQDYVEVRTATGRERRTVNLGSTNGPEVQIESGLKEGDEVILN